MITEFELEWPGSYQVGAGELVMITALVCLAVLRAYKGNQGI